MQTPRYLSRIAVLWRKRLGMGGTLVKSVRSAATLAALLGLAIAARLSTNAFASPHPPTKSGIWTDLSDGGPFKVAPETSLLLTDGTVVVHDVCEQWYRLTPDVKGRYETGTWSALPTMPGKYGPYYFASAILPDGRMIVNGGEYNGPTYQCAGGSYTN
jgi:hypothetical protein